MKKLLFLASLMLMCALNNSICAQDNKSSEVFSLVSTKTEKASDDVKLPFPVKVTDKLVTDVYQGGRGGLYYITKGEDGSNKKTYLSKDKKAKTLAYWAQKFPEHYKKYRKGE